MPKAVIPWEVAVCTPLKLGPAIKTTLRHAAWHGIGRMHSVEHMASCITDLLCIANHREVIAGAPLAEE